MHGPFCDISEEDSSGCYPTATCRQNRQSLRTFSQIQYELHKKIKEQVHPPFQQLQPTLVINRSMTNINSAMTAIVDWAIHRRNLTQIKQSERQYKVDKNQMLVRKQLNQYKRKTRRFDLKAKSVSIQKGNKLLLTNLLEISKGIKANQSSVDNKRPRLLHSTRYSKRQNEESLATSNLRIKDKILNTSTSIMRHSTTTFVKRDHVQLAQQLLKFKEKLKLQVARKAESIKPKEQVPEQLPILLVKQRQKPPICPAKTKMVFNHDTPETTKVSLPPKPPLSKPRSRSSDILNLNPPKSPKRRITPFRRNILIQTQSPLPYCHKITSLTLSAAQQSNIHKERTESSSTTQYVNGSKVMKDQISSQTTFKNIKFIRFTESPIHQAERSRSLKFISQKSLENQHVLTKKESIEYSDTFEQETSYHLPADTD